ncbi:hypothetical protein [Psychroflexus halocasei]|uniref:Uncharacterized protein n=1 Tax=Psychroflexus halocasei TaxID=908615 RepID=A0A1H3YMF8_9FLAO|nr:hypothetical protein [Psychroflexus halocasei]SEA12736.1 hypothetical protein SAMN05421540_103195 [Psychroflexus halocasei]
MINTKRQTVNAVLILIGAGLLIYDLVSVDDIVYIKIAGLVILMIGLYNSTKQWASDNPKNNDENEENLTENHLEEDYSIEDVPEDESKLN